LGQYVRRFRLCGRLIGNAGIIVRFPVPEFYPQQVFHAALYPPRPAGGGVLKLVATIVIGLPTLGSVPELVPQAFYAILQPTASKLLGRRLGFFLWTNLRGVLFFDFFDFFTPYNEKQGRACGPVLSVLLNSL